jgi:hypothetical protein
MADWILVPCLVSLRNEFNELAPDRDKATDGSIGDTSHAANSSDHNPDETGNTPYEDADSKNEVHAIDVDDDLRKSGWSMTRALNIIIERHRTGRDNRLQNIIYNRRIWSASYGWTAREYNGANAHTEHAHFGARYTTAQEADTRPWGLLQDEEDDMPTADEVAEKVVAKLLAAKIGDKAYPNRSVGSELRDLQVSRDFQIGDGKGAAQNPPKKGSFLDLLSKVPGTLTQHGQVLSALTRSLAANNADLDTILDELDRTPEQKLAEALDLLMTKSDQEIGAILVAEFGADRAAAIGDVLLATPPPAE